MPSGLPPNNVFGYVLFYICVYLFEIIFFKVTNVTDGFFQYQNIKKKKSSSSSDSNSPGGDNGSDSYDYEIIIEEEEEDDSENQIVKQQDKEWEKQQQKMKNGDEKSLPHIDIETGKQISSKPKKIIKQNKSNEEQSSSSSDERVNDDIIEVKANYCLSNWFWLIHFAAIAGIYIAATIYLPLLVEPSYGNVERASDKELLKTIRRVAKTVHFPLNSVFQMRDDRIGANIFVLGLNSKRIVLTEQFLDRLNRDETAAVVAREIGHWYNNDVIYGSFAKLFPFFLYSIFIQYAAHHGLKPFGFKKDIQPCVLIFLGIVVFDITKKFWIPITNVAMRSFERDADCFASSFDLPVANAISKLEDHSNSFLPPKLFRFFFESNPTTTERFDNLCHCKKVIWPKVRTNI